jgi:hypothetical protein
MAIEHRQRLLFGVQFHPESVLSESGHQLLGGFLRLAGVDVSGCPSGDFVVPPTEQDWSGGETADGQPLHW